ncbi:hypothetical protein OGZ39_03230 [Lactococcus lactis]|uniref:Uncharacterized protein n=1 Tax=Lactococcus lactis TaxID=1358 RepID=A0A9X4NBM7_9LACT|nr:hypothetical protein [Lactococcus lactis]MDG4980669.1 hypothetical protein [Lactococcus lactis]
MNAIELVQGAMKKAEKIRPKVGGFPYLAECMREAGVLKMFGPFLPDKVRFGQALA